MTSFSEKIASLRTMVDMCESELKSLEAGKKTSSVRARKCLQDIKMTSHAMRKDVTDFTKSLPTKSRVPKIAAPVEPESLPVPPVVEVPVEVAPVKPKPKPRRKKVVVE